MKNNANEKMIEKIEILLKNQQNENNYVDIKKAVNIEKNDLLQYLFQNKTIVYLNTKDFLYESKRVLINGKLVILNEF